MKIYSIIGILLFLSISIQLTAQSKPSLTESDIEGQFKYLISRADDYDDSKIVKRWILYTFKSHVMDTLDYLKKEIVVKDSLQQITVDEVAELKVKLEELEKNLKTVSKERDSLSLFGASMNKTAFYSIIIFIIIALTGVIVVFVVLYKRSNVLTVKAKSELKDLQEEYVAHRKTALKRHEKVVRELYDEILKYKAQLGK